MTDDRRLEEIRKRLGDSLGRYDLNDAVDDVTYLLERLDEVQEMFEAALREKGWAREIARLHEERIALQAQVAQMREAIIDRRSGRPQCRGCYAYLDSGSKVDVSTAAQQAGFSPRYEHTPDCWAKDAFSLHPLPSMGGGDGFGASSA